MGRLLKKRIRLKYAMGSVVIVLAILGAATASSGEIYKWVDEDGNVHYSQSPHKSAQKLSIHIQQPAASGEDANTTSEKPATEATTPAPDGQNNAEQEQARREATAKKRQEAQEKNCQISMKRLATISAGGRLYEVDAQGERSYWDDETRKAKLAEAQKNVDQWCSQE